MGKEVFESRGLDGREALVEQIKAKAGELDDLLQQINKDKSETAFNGHIEVDVSRVRPKECHRLTALARTNLEVAVMCAVKAVSRG